jgi:multiple sugar transport system substrate-binding protein
LFNEEQMSRTKTGRKDRLMTQQSGAAFTRRAFIGAAGGIAATTLLAACTRTGGGSGNGGGGKGGTAKFWNMPWGSDAFLAEDKVITAAYKPADGLPSFTYQQIQWANFTQTFQSAVASNTNPAVSSGGGTQAFQFAAQGKIAYADDLISSWEGDLKDDFLDGLLDTMKTDDGYAAIPYNLDVRCPWYNKELMEAAGATPPTTWDEYLDVCAKLKAKGYYGFGLGSGAGSFTGSHILTGFMINNGGGIFNEKLEPDLVTPENEEAIDFILEIVKKGYSDPNSATYTSANVQSQWKAKKFAFGWDGAGLPASVPDPGVAANLVVGEPLTSRSGKQGFLYFPNNIMMYKNTPSQKGSEAFLTYYYKNMKTLWTKKTGIGLPPLKSIANTAEVSGDPNIKTILDKWNPIYRTWGAPGTKGLFANVAYTVDGTQPMITFTQSILGGKVKAADALKTLQNQIEPLMK